MVSSAGGGEYQQHQHQHQRGLERSASKMRSSVSSFDHGCLSGRASAVSVGSFKHTHRTKDDENALWATHMVRGGYSREDLAADNDISEFQVRPGL